MAGRQDDFLTGADLDELHSLLDGGFLDENFDLQEELEPVVPEKTSEGQFLCERCSKTNKSQRGRGRHSNNKHQQTEAEDNFGLSREEAEALKKLHQLQLQNIIKKSAEKCSNDQCLPEVIRQNFCSDNFLFSLDDAVQLWNNFHAVIYEFNGDAEDFFSSYYGLLCANLLFDKFDDITLSNILLTEVANDMLIHLSGSDVVDVGIPQSSYDLFEKD